MVRGIRGRLFELGIAIDPTHAPSVLAAHEQFLAECRYAETLVAAGMDLPDAWEVVRRDSARASLDQPRTARRRRSTRT